MMDYNMVPIFLEQTQDAIYDDDIKLEDLAKEID